MPVIERSFVTSRFIIAHDPDVVLLKINPGESVITGQGNLEEFFDNPAGRQQALDRVIEVSNGLGKKAVEKVDMYTLSQLNLPEQVMEKLDILELLNTHEPKFFTKFIGKENVVNHLRAKGFSEDFINAINENRSDVVKDFVEKERAKRGRPE